MSAQSFMELQEAHAKVEAAKNLHNYSSVKLTNARIHERLCELRSQHDPLNKLCGGDEANMCDPAIRKIAYAAAFYVVVGRMPTDEHYES